jgi:outer membrane protein
VTSQSFATDNNYVTGLSAEKYLFDFGRTRGYVEQRRAEAAAATDNLAFAELDLTYQVADRYFALLAARQLVEVYKSAVTQRQAHLDEASTKAASGLTAGIDVYTAQSDLARVQLDLTNAVAGTAVAKAALNYAIGLGDRSPDYQPADVLTYSEVVTPISAFLDSALARRPDLASLQAEARAAGAQILQNRSDYLPTFTATANYSARGQGLPAANNFDAGVVVIWPLFNGFATEHAVEAAKLTEDRITHQIEDLRQQIFVEVQTAYLDLKSAREAIRQAEAAVAASRTELELAEKRYQAGLGNIIELTDASRRYVEDDANYVKALYGFSLARASLARAAAQSM